MALKGNIKGPTGATGSTGPAGPAGPFGGAVTLEFTFSTSTADSDPGNGHIACNNSPENGATALRISNVDINGVDITGITSTFGNSTSTPAGHLRLVSKSDPTKFLIFKNGVVSVGGGGAYKNVLVDALASSGSSPFAANDDLLLSWTRTGDVGTTGATGPQGTAGTNGTNGSTWYEGSIVPASGTGVNGDFYFRATTGDVYQKVAGSWGSPIANLTGPTGPAGSAGSGGTAGTNGSNGPGYVSGGRLTVTTGVPYLTANSTLAQTTIYFTPATGNTILLYDGTNMIPTTFAEVSQLLTDATKSPAATVANTCYDLFAWNDAGTFRVTRGPAWTNSITRGTGTALVRVNGVLLNNASITNGPSAQRGTYVGTICTDASNKLNMVFAASGAGGGGNRLDVWNMYNQALVVSTNIDTTVSWTYSLAAWAEKNSNDANKINFVLGQDAQTVNADQMQHAQQANAALIAIGFGLDSTTVLDSGSGTAQVPVTVAAKVVSGTLDYTTRVVAGFHYITPLLYATANGVTTWYGSTTLGTGLVPTISIWTLRLYM